MKRRRFIKNTALGSLLLTSGACRHLVPGTASNARGHKVFTSFCEPVVDPSHELYITWISNKPDQRSLEIRSTGGVSSWKPYESHRTREFPALPGYWLHTVVVRGLNPDTIYDYRVRGAGFADKVKTCRAIVPLNVVWACDWQMRDYSPDGFLWRLGDALTAHDEMDLLLLGGDYVDDDGRVIEEYSQLWLDYLIVMNARFRTRGGAQYPMLALIGNHEGRNKNRLDDIISRGGSAGSGGDGVVGQIVDIFSWSYEPNHPSRFANSCATMRIGNELFFMGLETDHTVPLSKQFGFFQKSLANHCPEVRHSFIGGHVPPFNNWSNNFTRPGDRLMRNVFWPEAQKYSGEGKSLRGWLAGHTHAVVVSSKLRMDYRKELSDEENDNRWFTHPEGLRQLGNGPMGLPAVQNIETINRISPIDQTHYWKAILKGDRRHENPNYFEIHGEGIMNPQIPLSHAWVYKLSETSWNAEAVNLDGKLFYQFSETI